MTLGWYTAALLILGSILAWAVLPYGDYVASLPATILAALPALALAVRIPRTARLDVKNYLWPTGAFVLALAIIAVATASLGGFGAQL